MQKATKWTKRKIRKGWEHLRPRPYMSKFQKAIRTIAVAAIVGALSLTVLLFFYTVYLLFVLPNPDELRDLNLTESTLIMDREGNLLYAIHGEENRESLEELDEISPWLIDATLAIEDDGFYHHIGIDIPAIIRAVFSEIGIGTPRGGSTITQQFVKNTFLSPEHSYKRKFQEILLSLLVELKFSKDEILLMYLNVIPYGSNAYGIELAADRYFEKDSVDLSLAESAVLASIPKAPTRYSPYGNYRNTVLHFELTEDREVTGEEDLEYGEFTRGLIGTTFENLSGESFYIKGRSDLVLDRMEELGMISEDNLEGALADIQAIEFGTYSDSIEAPHFVLWIKQMLEEKYGSAVVEQGGLKVYTTLDPDFQEAAETAIADKKEHNMDTFGAQNAALVSIHPQTGQVLAMVGSSDYFDDEIDGQVNMITSQRQPGSSFKPFVYALAFLNQYTPATVLYDVATKIGTDEPSNYDGEFWGPMTIRHALAQSRNIPAAKAYFLAGQEAAILPFIEDFGIESANAEGYGWPLALGALEITPLELAEAYMVFANGGIHIEPTAILKIENADGDVLEEWQEDEIERTEVLDPQAAYLINDILSDPSDNLGPSTRVDSIDNAAKTGTSNKKLSNGNILPNNAWLAAYTPSLVTITWTGNADGSTMNASGSGYSTAAPIWKNYITAVLDRLEPTNWNRPAEIKEMAISLASGTLPGDNTPSDMIATEVFANYAVPTGVDNSFTTILIETITDRLATEYSPESAVEERTYRVHRSILADVWLSWQEGIDAWAEEEGDDQPPVVFADNIHNENTAQNVPEVTITSPLSLSSIDIDTRIVEIEVEVLDEGNGLEEVEFTVDGKVHYHSKDDPYDGSIRIPTNAVEGSILEVTARAIDQYGYDNSSTIQLRIGDGGVEEGPEEEEEPEEEGPEEEEGN
jgi:membrane peptidoglycan carboxypeptidase